MPATSEKCISDLPSIRVPESLKVGLLKLALQDDRKFSEYIRNVLDQHVFIQEQLPELGEYVRKVLIRHSPILFDAAEADKP